MIRGLFDRLFGRKTDSHQDSSTALNLPKVWDIPNAPVPVSEPLPPPHPDDVRDWVIQHIARDVAGGFSSQDEIIQSAIEIYEGELPEDELEAIARREVPEAIARHQSEQADWPEVTDNDRLQMAIDTLARQGIVFRENFSCCGTCGALEIWDEIDEERAAGRDVRGYAFYHQQDTESAIEGDGLYLNYGATEEGAEAALGVAREVQTALEQHGLKTNWNGSWSQRLGIDIDWKRRNSVLA